MHKYFADWYRVASLKPQGDLLGNRWKSIEKLGKSKDASRAMDLVRLFRAKPLSNNGFLDECRTIFQETDPAFPMRGNELELRVLAGATTAWCLDNCSDKLADAVAFGLLDTSVIRLRSTQRRYNLRISTAAFARFMQNLHASHGKIIFKHQHFIGKTFENKGDT